MSVRKALHPLQRMTAVMLCLCLALSLCGCESLKQEREYKKQLSSLNEEGSALSDDVSRAVDQLTDALDNTDADAYSEALEDLKTSCDELYDVIQQMADLEAPEKYQSQQAELKGYAQDIHTMLDDSLELYDLIGQSLSSTLTEEQSARGSDLVTEIEEMQESAESFDSVVNEILGIADESSDESSDE